MHQFRRVEIRHSKDSRVFQDLSQPFPIHPLSCFLLKRDLQKSHFQLSQCRFAAFDPFFIHADIVVGNTQNLLVSHPLQIFSHLPSAVIIIDDQITDALRLPKISVIYNKRNVHGFPKFLIIPVTETDQDQSFHIPHRSDADDFIPVRQCLNHHKKPGPVYFLRQRIQCGGNKTVLQHMSLIFFMIIDDDTHDPGTVLRQKNPRHIRYIFFLFQKCLNPFHRLIRDLFRLSVNHIGYRRRTESQFLRNVCDPHSSLFHRTYLSFYPILFTNPFFHFHMIKYNKSPVFPKEVKRITYSKNQGLNL